MSSSTPPFNMVRVSLFSPNATRESFSGLVQLSAGEGITEPLQLFQAILKQQSFAKEVMFADFDVVLSEGICALYRRARFHKLWRMASDLLGLTQAEMSIGSLVCVTASDTLYFGREGVIVNVTPDHDRPYTVRLRGSSCDKGL